MTNDQNSEISPAQSAITLARGCMQTAYTSSTEQHERVRSGRQIEAAGMAHEVMSDSIAAAGAVYAAREAKASLIDSAIFALLARKRQVINWNISEPAHQVLTICEDILATLEISGLAHGGTSDRRDRGKLLASLTKARN